MNASGGVPGYAMIKSDMYKKYERWLCHKYYAIHGHAKQYDNECSSHVYDDDGSRMAIYLVMAMEMT